MPRAESNNRSDGLLKIIFFIHLVLCSWGMQSAWSFPTSFLFTNTIYMICILWSIASKDGVDSIAMAMIVNIITLFMDLFALTLFWPSLTSFQHKIFYIFALINSLIKPIVSLIMYRIFRDRDVDGAGIQGMFSDVIGMGDFGGGMNYDPRSSEPISPRGSTSQQGYQNFEPPLVPGLGPPAEEANKQISNLEDLQQNSTPTFTYQTLA